MAEMVDIRVTDPYDTIALLRDTDAQLDFIAVIRKISVESAELFPQITPYEEGETSSPRYIEKERFSAMTQQKFGESAYLVVIPVSDLISRYRQSLKISRIARGRS